MIFKRFQWDILVRVILLFVVLTATAFLLVLKLYIYAVLLLPVIIYQVMDFYNFHKLAQKEVAQFVESIQYRDFSRNFNVSQAPYELKPLRKGFNDITSAFKVISKEKETQYQYLQKILELVDTGILSYETESGEVVWMNESLKRMLLTPYLKTIHSLAKRDETLYNQVIELKPGNTAIATIHQEKNTFRILLSATAFQTEGKKFHLIAFQNVNEALDETESKAWQKLLSVMTHEIMNSVAPISSLADTLKNRLQESVAHLDNTNGVVDDLEVGINTIKRRSEGLLKFAEVYRNLNKIITPTLKHVFVRDLFENMHNLMEPTLEQKDIELEIILKDPDLTVDVDTNLIEQVLINLILNAIDAVKDAAEPRIILSAVLNPNQKVTVRVTDNGIGMTEDVMNNIFIPFFSTKKNGSGIGLSLCKQIMMLHKGNIQVQSVEGKGTAFLLQF
ncbi:sensor histidine kinase [Sediminibacterium ginsengisoli]|uniref:histidine kinase n=1 Tax=Sediminibacterium ginsengisoli TaxID=413434 RepID=A0A1T4PIV1_9BACT|nr:HAMP domain-containing sensor histidine kinase [Sediminibacterium ginsengisoli]SJZ91500.1 Histidine kinase-, DNA gyrase B-, and HSP90-like ATPase [Sediminibacterium ginsengisoli]